MVDAARSVAHNCCLLGFRINVVKDAIHGSDVHVAFWDARLCCCGQKVYVDVCEQEQVCV